MPESESQNYPNPRRYSMEAGSEAFRHGETSQNEARKRFTKRLVLTVVEFLDVLKFRINIDPSSARVILVAVGRGRVGWNTASKSEAEGRNLRREREVGLALDNAHLTPDVSEVGHQYT